MPRDWDASIDTQNNVPAHVTHAVDDAVVACESTQTALQCLGIPSNINKGLPDGSRVIDITPHGVSLWTRTAKIQTIQEDGSKVSFFIKVGFQRASICWVNLTSLQVLYGDRGKLNSKGEFASMTAIHAASMSLNSLLTVLSTPSPSLSSFLLYPPLTWSSFVP